MRPLLFLLIGLFIGCTTVIPGAPNPVSRVDQAAELEAKTVALVVTDEGGARAFCSGVWVSTTSILTAEHCVRDQDIGDRIEYVVRSDIYAPGSSQERSGIVSRGARLYARDLLHDLALLRAGAPPSHTVAGVTLEVAKPGMFVQTMGQPLGLWWSYSSGDVAAVRFDNGATGFSMLFVQTTAPTSPGNSGGALFDAYGQIVGVCHGSFTRGQMLNLFVHYTHVDAFLRRQVNL